MYRKGLGVVTVAAAVATILGAEAARADEPASTVTAAVREPVQKPLKINIAALPLDDALNEFARQSGLQIFLLASNDTKRLKSAPVSGVYEPKAALGRMLSDTGLGYEQIDARSIAVVDQASKSAVKEESRPLALARAQAESPQTEQRSSRGESEARVPVGSANHSGSLQEIIVTAQRREESLFEVPQSLTVLSPTELSERGASRLQDYLTGVPGVTVVSSGGPGRGGITMRGLNTGSETSVTVATYLDDVPIGSSGTNVNATRVVMDPALFDLERIEVLRGPQGTLYGASAIGGLVKYVTASPDLDELKGSARLGVGRIHEGAENYNGSLSVNVPLVRDRVAIKGMVYSAHDSGYVDNVAPGFEDEDIGTSDVTGGRVDLLIAPTAGLSLRLSAFAQDIDRDGAHDSAIDRDGRPRLGDLLRVQQFGVPAGTDQKMRVYSLNVDYATPLGNLTSISAWQEGYAVEVIDTTLILGPIYEPALGTDFESLRLDIFGGPERFSQEVRLSSSEGAAFEWLAGVFYAQEDGTSGDLQIGRDASGVVDLGVSTNRSSYEEKAAFVNLDFPVGEHLHLGGGLRYANIVQDARIDGRGVFGETRANSLSEDDVATWLANVRYQFNPDTMAYLRFATGFRPGGPNTRVLDETGQPVGPESFGSDRVLSYEAGFRAQASDGRLGGELAVYTMDWDNIQVVVVDDRYQGYRTNAPDGATARGIEASVFGRPAEALSLRGTYTWQDTEMNADTLALGAKKGERLPWTPQHQASFAADYFFRAGEMDLTAGLVAKYFGSRKTGFPDQRPYLVEDYVALDVALSTGWGENELTLYATNVTDERKVLHSNNAGTAVVMRPRTLGLSYSRRF